MSLSAVLQFYLWAFPPYRAIIETSLDLNSRLQGPGGEAGVALVDEVISQAEEWIRRIPIAIGHVAQVDRATHVPWLRFRAEVLKRVGRRPMGPVY